MKDFFKDLAIFLLAATLLIAALSSIANVFDEGTKFLFDMLDGQR